MGIPSSLGSLIEFVGSSFKRLTSANSTFQTAGREIGAGGLCISGREKCQVIAEPQLKRKARLLYSLLVPRICGLSTLFAFDCAVPSATASPLMILSQSNSQHNIVSSFRYTCKLFDNSDNIVAHYLIPSEAQSKTPSEGERAGYLPDSNTGAGVSYEIWVDPCKGHCLPWVKA